MELQLTDKKNDTSNSFSVNVGQTDDEFCYCFKVENLKLIKGDYNVTVSKKNVALFEGEMIKYFIALGFECMKHILFTLKGCPYHLLDDEAHIRNVLVNATSYGM